MTHRLRLFLTSATIALTIAGLFYFQPVHAATVLFSEDFSSFTGAGFTPNPTAGQLDSDIWRITGLSDGDMVFGGTYTTGDYARGIGDDTTTTGGIYAFDLGVLGANNGLGIKPTGDDMTPGEITVRVQNTTGQYITALRISSEFSYTGDNEGGVTATFYYTIDETWRLKGFTKTLYTEPTDSVVSIDTYVLNAIPPGDFFHVTIRIEDNTGGTESVWGEVALNSLEISAHATADNLVQNGTFEAPYTNSDWLIATQGSTNQRFETPRSAQGDSIHFIQVAEATETVRQNIPYNGTNGDTIQIHYMMAGIGLDDLGGQKGMRIQLWQNGSEVQKAFCLVFESGTFNWQRAACQMTATSDYDEIRLAAGGRFFGESPDGKLGIDNMLVYVLP